MQTRSIRVWWNPRYDNISLGEFLVMCARDFSYDCRWNLVVDRDHSVGSGLPDLHFCVWREGDKTIIEKGAK